jgi:hypothetical protein
MSVAFGLARTWEAEQPEATVHLQAVLAQAGWGIVRGPAWGLHANAPLDWRALVRGADAGWKGPYHFTLPTVSGEQLAAALELLCPRSRGIPLIDILPLAPLPPNDTFVIDTHDDNGRRWRIIAAKWLLRQWQALPTDLRAAAERSFQLQHPADPHVSHLWFCAALAEMAHKALETHLPLRIRFAERT